MRLRDEGFSATQIAARLDREKHRVCQLAIVDSLKYLHKGGPPFRRSRRGRRPAGHQAGHLLGGWQGQAGGQARGLPGAYVAMFKLIDEKGGIDPKMDYVVGYTAQKKRFEPVQQYLTGNLGLNGSTVCHVGPAVGTHIGPGAAGLCFFANKAKLD